MKVYAMWILPALALGSVGGAGAQQATPAPLSDPANVKVQLSLTERRSFQSSIDTIASQGHIAIVAEGVPYHRTLPDDKTAKFAKEAPLAVTLPALAAAYDYEVEYRSKDRVYLLKKRYSDIRDLPAVTLEECTLTTQDILTVLRPFAISTQFPVREMAIDKVIPELAATLTPEQMQGIHDSKLTVAMLTPEQKAQVWQFVLYFYSQTPFEQAEEAAFNFREAPTDSVGIQPAQVTRIGVFPPGFCHRTKTYDGQPVLRGFGMHRGHSTTVTYSSGVATIHNDGLFLPPEEAETPGRAALPLPLTLAQEVAALNTRGLHANVDAALRPKPISVAGDGNAMPKQVLQALADVYGLRVAWPDGKDKAVQLTRPLFRVPLEIAALRECAWGIVPEPLQRVVHRGELVEVVREEEKALASPPVSFIEAMDHAALHRTQYWELTERVQEEAVRRLQLSFERRGRQKQNTFVPVAALAESDREAYGIAMIMELLDALRTEYDRPTPGWITNFNQLVLRGGPFIHEDAESKWKFALNVAYPDPSGTKLLDGPGAGGVAYFPPQQ